MPEKPQVFKNITPSEQRNSQGKEETSHKFLPDHPIISPGKLIEKDPKQASAQSAWSLSALRPTYPKEKFKQSQKTDKETIQIEAEGATPELQKFFDQKILPAWAEGIRDESKGGDIYHRLPNIYPRLEEKLTNFINQNPEVYSPQPEDIAYLAKHLKAKAEQLNLNSSEQKYLGSVFSLLLNSLNLQDLTQSNQEKITKALQPITALTEVPQDYLFFKLNQKDLTLTIDQAGDDLGKKMQGGTIYVKEAGGFLGYEMQGGTIYVEKAGWYLGKKMQGGTIKVEKAGWYLGKKMQGGTIYVEKAVWYLGHQMQGGTIYVKEAGDFLGYEMQGGTIYVKEAGDNLGYEMQGGTIYVERYKHIAGSAPQDKIYCYDEKKQTYANLTGKEAQEIATDKEIEEFKKEKQGLVIINQPDKLKHPDSITKGLTAGIIVLKERPSQPLGQDMAGGLVIIDEAEEIAKLRTIKDPAKKKQAITAYLDSLKPLVHPQKQGGLILARVPDPDNPDKTTALVVG